MEALSLRRRRDLLLHLSSCAEGSQCLTVDCSACFFGPQQPGLLLKLPGHLQASADSPNSQSVAVQHLDMTVVHLADVKSNPMSVGDHSDLEAYFCSLGLTCCQSAARNRS